MRSSKALVGCLLSLSVLAACGDDPVGTGVPDTTQDGGSGTVPDGVGRQLPDRPADLEGTITSVTPFVPITEDCVPLEDAPPDSSVSSDDPPYCTPEDNDALGSITVEELPGETTGGRKISYTVTAAATITGADKVGTEVRSFSALAVGQTGDTWVAGGVCAESYPEQCGLEAIRITG